MAVIKPEYEYKQNNDINCYEGHGAAQIIDPKDVDIETDPSSSARDKCQAKCVLNQPGM